MNRLAQWSYAAGSENSFSGVPFTVDAVKDGVVTLLGVSYALDSPSAVEDLFADLQSRMYFTYRRDFPRIEPATYQCSSDAGWGCMLRTAQMMLAQVLSMHYLGRTWQLPSDATLIPPEAARIIRWFLDSPTGACPLSAHKIVQTASLSGYTTGEWFSPHGVCSALQKLIAFHFSGHLTCYLSDHCTLYTDSIRTLCTTISAEERDILGADVNWIPVILFIPLRLGLDVLNPEYRASLLSCLESPHCVGFIGGSPRHSLYFFGSVGDQLLFLDPHQTRSAIAPDGDIPASEYFRGPVRTMNVADVDPCLALGFYCRTERDFEEFVSWSSSVIEKGEGGSLFTVAKAPPSDALIDDVLEWSSDDAD